MLGVSLRGRVFGQFIKGGCTAAIFGEFLTSISTAMTGTSYCVILDNATAHQSRLVKAIAKEKSILLAFPPPYSPEYCPIEMAFSFIKTHLTRYCIDSRHSLTYAIATTCASMTPQYCRSIFGHAFYKLTKDANHKFKFHL